MPALKGRTRDGEQFGTERLAAIVRRFNDRKPEIIVAELHDAVMKFAEGTPQQDDLTLVLIKRPTLPTVRDVSDLPKKNLACTS